jgi:hypothetical protein
LHRAFGRGLQFGVDHDARPQVPPDQRQQPFVADLPGHPHHQHVVLDAVEEFRQIHVNALTKSGADVGLDLLRCSLGGASGSKAEARFREAGIEDRREDLQDGLLKQAVDHVGDTEVPLTAIRFGNRLTPGRARVVSSFQELPLDLRPLRAEGLTEFVQGDAIGARGSAVCLDVPPSRFHVGSVDNPFHQVV